MTGPPWRRLDGRVVWVDAVRSLLALAPTGLAVTVFQVEARFSALWPVLTVAVVGVAGAVRDLLRWLKTRYRITEDRVELRAGLLLRRHRSVRRDRIRSVEATALLRHRLAGLRVVTVGAGLPGTGGEAALRLDAVSVATAERLRRDLLRRAADASTDGGFAADGATTHGGFAASGAATRGQQAPTADSDPSGADTAPGGSEPPAPDRAVVLARIRWSWIVHNVVNFWSFVMAAGLLWGAYWTAESFGVDVVETAAGWVDWHAMGAGRAIALGVAAAGLLGVAGMAVAFVAEYWDFRLLRVPVPGGSVLRTRHGLFKTREIDRDDGRLRGVRISEPVLWRWMGTADTDVVTTGLTVWSMTPATTVLPRGPVRVARAVAGAVLEADPNPFAASLRPHPRAALRRRAGWALLAVALGAGALAVLDALLGPSRLWPAGLAAVPLAPVAAVVAYRALGHTVTGGYLVVRSGLVSRSTVALRGPAVIGWRVRQSVLQRRLGLATLTATTAAGRGRYAAVDMTAADVTDLAERARPGLLAPFVLGAPTGGPPVVGSAGDGRSTARKYLSTSDSPASPSP
ncbi:putative membrane protein [Micromonospora citrea]|uniref:Putative membrane protein n=1 Tax=Micromonospora citrea TaxID=47855 RepID=A0A1C6W2J8_9ACTN|nr:PH domain-containing protein [Micromonospora citrea]SCL72736.1 putative membrane protein [Micromonospora citrea]